MKKVPVIGPTFSEMLNPERVDSKIRKRALEMKKKDPLHPINLFNISWKNEDNEYYYFILPSELTGVKPNIIVLYAKEFPSGSHKVGATYSILAEKTVSGEVDPFKHTLVWPSTGNYGIGGAWVSSRMNYKSIVLLPELMSKERFEIIRAYGAEVIATPGCESNVKEIYDKAKELYNKDPEKIRILNQFEEFGNYRFHYYVTGNSMIDLVKKRNIGNGKISAVVLGVGSAGTIASGDRVKQEFPNAKVVAVEPLQCPTISLNGYGGHDIQGIGDKHVTWIHNVLNNDAVVLVDDIDSKKMLHVFSDPVGKEFLKSFVNKDLIEFISDKFGISGVANLIGAIKVAKHYKFGADDNIFIVATDSIERYRSVMNDLEEKFGKLTLNEAKNRYERIISYQEPSWIFEGTMYNKERWHNLKYYTWVEQQGKTVEELNAQRDYNYWKKEQEKVEEIDELIVEYREKHKNELEKIYFED
ncbi:MULTISPECIES: pyridoxal-phosphate dependent enzyme [unclassified Thermosipho (in: thermotogales)]|uniref:PLP-dependent cysteine synthase family protein n=1 Tax=unclassified Thermosipho (in: thermotogales) TaxID=2676525 RepID=UPI000984232F|nr:MULTISPECIES: pyridoxal-phosphate dependent enzyme [unclassified Thermosipho (in: thermotogales)]MBT1248732.1 pyridoxal-5'-phosphate-dependent protein subunit beta [Thermosipho sp. 1244]OOC47659.1 pyridoxal-5'-phosphate-dependent protein subunit beta [Thermosipho sp. 1223]